MIVLHAKNVHCALPVALHKLRTQGIPRESRNGLVRQMPEPVATVYANPCERVIFHPWRDANPFFHFYEALWMLAGRNDIAPLVRFSKQIGEYTDDGETMNAAYGSRWRCMPKGFNGTEDRFTGPYTVDQLPIICNALRANKDDRQQVLQIWDHNRDLGTKTKDHACNLTVTFQVDPGGRLNMVVFCRSNDAVWGCYGANAVHFSFLLEYVAARAGYPCGIYTQVSVNLHAYDATAAKLYEFGAELESDAYDPYGGAIYPYPIGNSQTDWYEWDGDCQGFITMTGHASTCSFKNAFFNDVAWPIVKAHDAYKDGDPRTKFSKAKQELNRCQASDWKKACQEWLDRRQLKLEMKNAT